MLRHPNPYLRQKCLTLGRLLVVLLDLMTNFEANVTERKGTEAFRLRLFRDSNILSLYQQIEQNILQISELITLVILTENTHEQLAIQKTQQLKEKAYLIVQLLDGWEKYLQDESKNQNLKSQIHEEMKKEIDQIIWLMFDI
jgi:hypothetical protein